MTKKTLFIPLASFLLLVGAAAASEPPSQAGNQHANTYRPSGAWLLTINYPAFVGIPPFQEILVFHDGGTVSETNATLHANSANPGFPFNASPGYGSWENAGDRRAAFEFTKLLFDGLTNQHVGYLVVSGKLTITGDTASQTDPADASVALYICADVTQYPDTCIVDQFPAPTATGRRL